MPLNPKRQSQSNLAAQSHGSASQNLADGRAAEETEACEDLRVFENSSAFFGNDEGAFFLRLELTSRRYQIGKSLAKEKR